MVALSIRKLMRIKKYFNIFQLDFFYLITSFLVILIIHCHLKVKHSVPFRHKLKRTGKEKKKYVSLP